MCRQCFREKVRGTPSMLRASQANDHAVEGDGFRQGQSGGSFKLSRKQLSSGSVLVLTSLSAEQLNILASREAGGELRRNCFIS